jgi:hypothetical protein
MIKPGVKYVMGILFGGWDKAVIRESFGLQTIIFTDVPSRGHVGEIVLVEITVFPSRPTPTSKREFGHGKIIAFGLESIAQKLQEKGGHALHGKVSFFSDPSPSDTRQAYHLFEDIIIYGKPSHIPS